MAHDALLWKLLLNASFGKFGVYVEDHSRCFTKEHVPRDPFAGHNTRQWPGDPHRKEVFFGCLQVKKTIRRRGFTTLHRHGVCQRIS